MTLAMKRRSRTALANKQAGVRQAEDATRNIAPTPTRPLWIKLPPEGRRCAWSGYARSTLVDLITEETDGKAPPVKGRYFKRPGAKKGSILINLESLLEFIEKLPPPGRAA